MTVTWKEMGWSSLAQEPAWPESVCREIQAHFQDGRPLLEPVILRSARVAIIGAAKVVEVIYDPSYIDRRLGIRVRVDVPPPDSVIGGTAGDKLTERFADYIVYGLISEPLGTNVAKLKLGTEGVWWWGYTAV